MKLQIPKLISLVMFLGILVMSCSKSDPAPLKAQVNAAILAGDKGKSKAWKLIGLSYQTGSGSPQSQTLSGCFGDNVYTFTNNDAQAYVSTEGTSKCGNGTGPDTIEQGTWAFTLDGLTLMIGVDDTFSSNGLFSPEAILYEDTSTTPSTYYAFTIGYPYPAFVQTITASSLVLVITNTVGSSTYTYTLTFVSI